MLVHFFLQESLFLRLRMNLPFFGNLNLERSLNVLESFISTVKVLLETELFSVYCRCNKKTALLILKNVPISFEFFVLLDNRFPFLSLLFNFHTKKKKKKKKQNKDVRYRLSAWVWFQDVNKILVNARPFWQKVSQKKIKKDFNSFNQLSVPIRSK